MTNSPFTEIERLKFLRVPHAEDLIKEVITEDCYEIRSLQGQHVFIDCGSCYGEAALFAYSLGHVVVAVEPSLNSYQVAQLNMSLNGISNMKHMALLKRSISDSSEGVGHYYREDHPAGSGYTKNKDAKLEMVDPISILTLIKAGNAAVQDGVKLPVAIKMDIEGAEYAAFKNHDQWLPMVDFIAMETHNFDSDHFAKILTAAGFDVRLTGTGKPPRVEWNKTMCGGLVIARRKKK